MSFCGMMTYWRPQPSDIPSSAQLKVLNRLLSCSVAEDLCFSGEKREAIS
jgi:hypothetical protein